MSVQSSGHLPECSQGSLCPGGLALTMALASIPLEDVTTSSSVLCWWCFPPCLQSLVNAWYQVDAYLSICCMNRNEYLIEYCEKGHQRLRKDLSPDIAH